MDLERRVEDLTKRVAVLEAALIAAPAVALPPNPPGLVAPKPLGPPMGPPTGAPLTPPSPRRTPSTFEWGIESVLRWAGVALVTLAAIFLVSTAVSRDWIGPELQLLGAALGGAILLGGAIRLTEDRRPWALALGCGGTIVLIASALATHEWLDLVGPGPAVVLAAIAVVGSGAVALHTRLEGIALVAGVVGLVAPLDTLDPFGSEAVLAWVAAFILGTAALGLVTRWAGLRLVTGWLGALLLMVYAVSEDAHGLLQAMGFVGAALIGSVLWSAPTIGERLGGSRSWGSFDWTPIDYRLVALVPGWVAVIVAGLLSLADSSHNGVVAVLTAAGFLGLVELTYGRVSRTVSLATLLGSFGLLAVGLAIYFDGPALMVALAGQAATSYFLSRRLDDVSLLISSYAAAVISSLLAVQVLLEAMDDGGFDTIGQGLATALVVLCWIGATVAVRNGHEENTPFEIPFIGAWIGALLWSAAALTGAPQGLLLISVAWAIMACAGLVIGLTRRIAAVKNVALVTLALTLGKLVTVDLAEVDVFWRVGLFFVIGMGLITLGLKVPSLVGPKSPATDNPATDNPATDNPGDATVTTF